LSISEIMWRTRQYWGTFAGQWPVRRRRADRWGLADDSARRRRTAAHRV